MRWASTKPSASTRRSAACSATTSLRLPPHWLYYFGVDGVDSAVERVKANGGEILMGPVEVPGGAFVVNAKDPQGGFFAFLGMRG
ncbi:VOC family protein [Caulobacter segnis]